MGIVVADLLAEAGVFFPAFVVHRAVLQGLRPLRRVHPHARDDSVPLSLSLFGRFGVRVALVTYAASMAAKTITVALVLVVF